MLLIHNAFLPIHHGQGMLFLYLMLDRLGRDPTLATLQDFWVLNSLLLVKIVSSLPLSQRLSLAPG